MASDKLPRSKVVLPKIEVEKSDPMMNFVYCHEEDGLLNGKFIFNFQ